MKKMNELQDCTQLLGDPGAMQSFMDVEGYLLLRGVFPRQLIERLCDQVIEGLTHLGGRLVGSDPTAIQLPDEFNILDVHKFVDYSVMWTDQEALGLLAQIVGSSVYVWRAVILRAMAPYREAYRAVPHQDGYFSDVNDDYRTFWTPLAPVDADMGGLAIIPRSHKAGLRQVILSENRMANGGGQYFRTIRDEDLGGEWACSSEMEPGDLIVIHPFVIHQGRPNISSTGRVRLSMDWRAQPITSPRCPTSLFTVPEFDQNLYMDENGRYQLVPS